ncbi:hypothetical protein [Segatella copri]|nr:hypothetical protein [Segatella copri]
MRYLPLIFCMFLLSCGPSKKDIQEEIESKNDTIMILKKEISEQSEYIDELQEKLDNARSYAEDVQAALDDGSFSDAYDAASDAESEADYDDY